MWYACRLYADRQRLSAMVVENLLPSSEGGEEGDSPLSLNTITLQLEENLKEEQRFNCRMLYTVFKLGLNPVQVSSTVPTCRGGYCSRCYKYVAMQYTRQAQSSCHPSQGTILAGLIC